jgi:aspartokinase-like uncharacterized kinase
VDAWVVKLGGSLAESAALSEWLAVLARAGRGRTIVVPGGGPFADAVRAAQRRSGLDDSTAHSMALLAMDQYGHQLAAMGNRAFPGTFTLTDTRPRIDAALAASSVAVWLPARMTDAEPHLPREWDLTSDSIAAWFAGVLHARGLVLVKSVALPEQLEMQELVQRSWVDARFPESAAAAGVPVRVFGAGQQALLEQLLASRQS